jgi:hypothetical protein
LAHSHHPQYPKLRSGDASRPWMMPGY